MSELPEHFYPSFTHHNHPVLGRFELPKLGRINAIVGQNGVGKSLMLGAIEQDIFNINQAATSTATLPDNFPITKASIIGLLIHDINKVSSPNKKLRTLLELCLFVYDPSLKAEMLEDYHLPDCLRTLLDFAHKLYIAQNDVALIDNIDNGLHPLSLERLWKFLWWSSFNYNVQIFCVFYSHDCLKALGQFIGDNHDFTENRMIIERSDIYIHRIELGKSESIVFDKNEIEIAVDRDLYVL